MARTNHITIEPNRAIKPTIYAYITPTNTAKDGWIKIGYTERDADTRIKEQTHTAGVKAEKLWDYEARFNGGGYFTDHDFHAYLTRYKNIKREDGTEWFYFNEHPEKSSEYYREFTFKDYKKETDVETSDYVLRDEQADAVRVTYEYFKNNPGGEFLWNAKPRFGKTLTSYDLARKLKAETVLVVTNRPAIANSWYDDFEKFIEWQTDYVFVSESPSLKDRNPMTRDEFLDYIANPKNADAKMIAFISLQDLKGSKYFGGYHDKLKWVRDLNWDLLIIDEAHEGVDTFKTDVAFDQLKRNYTLHLSGTPFNAIASGKFSEDQIYNWSYADEQKAKADWSYEKGNNPYEALPKLNMYTYQMSKMIVDEVKQGADIEGENIDYAFDLNEFFSTSDNGRFVYEDDVKKWLDTLTSNEKYPFSTPELRDELKHTFWLLDRVASVKALEKLLRKHPVFKDYEIIIAAGDGKPEEESVDFNKNASSLERVREAIKNNDKTITLSVGQLTTGVTIPEWTAVLMLSNVKSPALYMQAAFRAQNPYEWTDKKTDTRYRKQNAYVFDFAPERTLIIFDEFANNLNATTAGGSGTTEERRENVQELLNFFPVIGEDSQGRMVELDSEQVMTIPRKVKAQEVVRRGFMSNLLFANISGIFRAPAAVAEVLEKLKEADQGRAVRVDKPVSIPDDIEVDEDGNAKIDEGIVINKSQGIFGSKVYTEDINQAASELIQTDSSDKNINAFVKVATENVAENISKVGEEYKLTKARQNTITKQAEVRMAEFAKSKMVNHEIQKSVIEKDFSEKIELAETKEEKVDLAKEQEEKIFELIEQTAKELKEQAAHEIKDIQDDIIKIEEQRVANKEKSEVENNIRSRLRGFAQTIPSFIMAYGDRDLKLSNFEKYTPADVFKEVTGITLGEFLFLRDGGTYEEGGEVKEFEGNLFDEAVFDESIQEFLNKKEELADYFEDHDEDIFDYIPPQETNQIYTPKWVVKKMVDQLEEENPGIYDDSTKTFLDPYMKSGLYITEIVKKLYNSPVIKAEIPDDHKRLKHILENQVYGFAPTEIIYRIATNFIFGELSDDISRGNFKQIDTLPYAKEGKMQELVDEVFGK